MKDIYIKDEFIKLGQFLKFVGLIDNGSQAKTFLISSSVYVNGEIEHRRGKKLFINTEISINDQKFIIRKG